MASVATKIADGSYLPDRDVSQPGAAPIQSLMDVVAGDADPRAYEKITGVPGSLGLLAEDAVMAHLADLPLARAFAKDWVDAPAPGADLSAVPGRMALWLLDQIAESSFGADHADARAMMKEVRDLHVRDITGEKVGRAEWASIRERAIALTDTLEDEGPYALGKLVETLAWPALTARTTLVEGARIYVEIATSLVRLDSDIGPEERMEIDRTMEALFEETAAEREADPENFFFPDIFKARYPEMHDRFVADLELSNKAHSDAITRCGDQAISLIRAASHA